MYEAETVAYMHLKLKIYILINGHMEFLSMLMLLPGSTGISRNLPYTAFPVLLSVMFEEHEILSSGYSSSGRVL